ncbi:ribosome biogenesis protein SLX9-domain-containing protein [Mucidula mucida]|nr:ribosome biogenesis protein SLX9-domain-containing protein [Mucidula mucida]
MPKDIRKKSTTRHAHSAKNHRAQEDEITPTPSTSQSLPQTVDSKRAKHEALMQRIDDSRAPYSKSHARRVKRKSREQLAGGMNDLESVLHTLAADDPAIVPANDIKTGRPDSKPKAKQIGEGKGATLSEKQRKKQLALERLRHPLILSNPQFAVNPFETIRTHARNTLLKHSVDSSNAQ